MFSPFGYLYNTKKKDDAGKMNVFNFPNDEKGDKRELKFQVWPEELTSIFLFRG
jgi:hypothetical protein